MTGALLSTALAVLLWPDPRALRRSRMTAVTPKQPPGVRWRTDVPVPVAAATLATALGAIASTPLVAGLAGGVVFLLARGWTAGRAEYRSEQELRGLTEAVAVLAAELRSGQAVAAAADTAARACPDAEIGRALAVAVQAPSGVPAHRDPGLRAALERIAAGASLSARTGCSLAAVLAAVEDDLRARSRFRLELRAATSGPRAGAAVLAGLPALGLAMGSGVGADPWRVLTTTPVGQALLVAGVVLEAAGVWWSRWLVGRAVP